MEMLDKPIIKQVRLERSQIVSSIHKLSPSILCLGGCIRSIQFMGALDVTVAAGWVAAYSFSLWYCNPPGPLAVRLVPDAAEPTVRMSGIGSRTSANPQHQ